MEVKAVNAGSMVARASTLPKSSLRPFDPRHYVRKSITLSYFSLWPNFTLFVQKMLIQEALKGQPEDGTLAVKVQQ